MPEQEAASSAMSVIPLRCLAVALIFPVVGCSGATIGGAGYDAGDELIANADRLAQDGDAEEAHRLYLACLAGPCSAVQRTFVVEPLWKLGRSNPAFDDVTWAKLREIERRILEARPTPELEDLVVVALSYSQWKRGEGALSFLQRLRREGPPQVYREALVVFSKRVPEVRAALDDHDVAILLQSLKDTLTEYDGLFREPDMTPDFKLELEGMAIGHTLDLMSVLVDAKRSDDARRALEATLTSLPAVGCGGFWQASELTRAAPTRALVCIRCGPHALCESDAGAADGRPLVP